MSKFNEIEMSQIVICHPHVEQHKILGIFGNKVRYQPTKSLISSYRNYYNAKDGATFLTICEASSATTEECILASQEMKTTENGDFRVDLCISDDAQFVAFQVFERQKDEYNPISTIKFLEGDVAEKFEQLLA